MNDLHQDPNKLVVWPDGDYCYGDELESYGYNKSDDYTVVAVEEIPDTMDHDDAAEWIANHPNFKDHNIH